MSNKPPKLTDRKRAAIIKAAAAEFQSRGYESTSMDRVAARAKVSKRTVYNHFASKEQLFHAIALDVWNRAIEVSTIPYRADVSLERQLTTLGEQKLDLLRSADYLDLMRAVLAECLRSPSLAGRVFSRFSLDEDALEKWLRAASKDKRLRVTNHKVAAEQFWALTKGTVFLPLLLGLAEPPSKREAKTMVRSAVNMFLRQYATQ